MEGVGLEGVTDLELLDVGQELLLELVVDLFVDKDSRTGAACLTVVEEDTWETVSTSSEPRSRQLTESRPSDSLLEIRIVKDDVGGLAAQLESDGLQVGSGSGLHDHSTDGSGTGKGDLSDFGVFRDGGTDGLAVTLNDVDDTLSKVGQRDRGQQCVCLHRGDRRP